MPGSWEIAGVIVKWILYGGVTGSTGLVLVSIVFPGMMLPLGRSVRKAAGVLAGIALVASVLDFALPGAALMGEAVGMIDPIMLSLLWQTLPGDVMVYRVTGMAMVVAGLLVPNFGKWISIAGGFLALWSFTQIGHVSNLHTAGIHLLLFAHLLGITFWVGILGPLRALSRSPEQLATAAIYGHRFGRAAMLIVPALILAGMLMVLSLVGSPRALAMTGYGLTLLSKVVLVGLLLALAAANKFRFVPAMRAGDARAGRRLARSIEIEMAIFAAVFLATAILTGTMTVPS